MKGFKIFLSVALVFVMAFSAGCGTVPDTEEILNNILSSSASLDEAFSDNENSFTETEQETEAETEPETEKLIENVKSIKFEDSNPVLKLNDDYDNYETLEFNVDYDGSISEEDFTYEISDSKILKVEELKVKTHILFDDEIAVKIKALKVGKAYLTLKTADGRIKSNRVKITVNKVESIDIENSSPKKLKLNKTAKITADADPSGIKKSDISVKSSNKKVVKVKSVKCKKELFGTKITVKIVGLKTGKSTLTIKAKQGSVKDKIKIKVYKPKAKKTSYVSKAVVNSNPTVYITDSGDKYHSYGCRYLKSSHAVTLSEAKARGKTRCSVCNPPY